MSPEGWPRRAPSPSNKWCLAQAPCYTLYLHPWELGQIQGCCVPEARVRAGLSSEHSDQAVPALSLINGETVLRSHVPRSQSLKGKQSKRTDSACQNPRLVHTDLALPDPPGDASKSCLYGHSAGVGVTGARRQDAVVDRIGFEDFAGRGRGHKVHVTKTDFKKYMI